MSPADLASLASRARAEAACPNIPVTPKDAGRLWSAIADLAGLSLSLTERVAELEARPRAGRPPKIKQVA